MKLHIVTIGKPKLTYAKLGWKEYIERLSRMHEIRTTHLADKWANDAHKISTAAVNAHLVALVVDGPQYTSHELAAFLDKVSYEGREVCFLIGGPDGLPPAITEKAQTKLSLSKLTFPHDLAMIILAETLYRASTINTNHPYHH